MKKDGLRDSVNTYLSHTQIQLFQFERGNSSIRLGEIRCQEDAGKVTVDGDKAMKDMTTNKQ